ncbi:restriction endonuclease subunit S [Petrotoga sp. 9PWA.NaAc.5.4]|uniref:restriction endonuclease subunit S n=1 Tax=Petrotoga sp. 9PWA.NaAc.5.4 TaxID=1434328 RepID=UPI000CA7006C|nr:restriction endonuclease subunit S [Petrotoga sp. 9PWA.NaAc.5.4]PNR92760.1 restriction endonuclease [Petrotoga sp. 9PWA.NaAc.5.4]
MYELKGGLPEDFKMTELGPLPEEWEVVKLGDAIEELKEKNKSNVDLKVFTVSNMEGFVLSDRFFGKRVYSKDTDNYKIVRQGYFAYNPYRINVGSIGLFKEIIGLVSPAYVVFKVKRTDCLHPEFLFRLLKSPFYMSEIQRIAMSRGSVRRSLSYRDLSDFKIPLPPLSEQEKIAAVLSAVQEAKEKTEAVIRATKEFKKSMMSYLFTYGPVALPDAENVPLKETEVGMIPEEWEVVRLGDVANKSYSGGTPSTSKEEYWNGSIPWTTSAIIGEEDVFLDKFQKTITKSGLESSSTKITPRNTLLVGTRVGVGKAVITRLDVAINQDLTAIELNTQRMLPVFIAYFFKIEGIQKWFENNKRGATIKGIPRKDLLNILIPLPPLPVQQKIASILSAIDRKIEAEEDKKKALEDLFKTLLHNLMTAKIRVNNLEVGA